LNRLHLLKDNSLPLFGFIVSVSVMLLAARGDLWLDEIWSIYFAESAKTPWEIITRFRQSNNHLLNTFYLYLLGPQSNLFLYRLPAVLSGIGTIIVLFLAARRWGTFDASAVVFLAGFSYPLINYFSEARGYAPAMFFSVLAFETLQRSLARSNITNILLFWSACALGFLSHLTSVMIFLALISLSVVYSAAGRASLKQTASTLLRYFAVPTAFLGAFYVVYFKKMIVGAGPDTTKMDVLFDTASLVLGFPDFRFLQIIAAACVLCSIVAGAFLLYRKRRPEWIFFLVSLLIAPGLFVIINHSNDLYFRYFIVCLPFYYLMLSHILGEWRRSGHLPKVIPVLLIAVFIVGHSYKTRELIRYGRGNYSRAVADMAVATQGPILKVSSDHDFRNKIILEFYTKRLPTEKILYYVSRERISMDTPDWFVVHSLDTQFRPYEKLALRGFSEYNLFSEYRSSGLSGWNWYVYSKGKTGSSQ